MSTGEEKEPVRATAEEQSLKGEEAMKDTESLGEEDHSLGSETLPAQSQKTRQGFEATLRTLITAVGMFALGCNGGGKKVVDKNGKEWPECIPPDPNDPFGKFNNNLTVNGTPYFCSPEGYWVVDQKIVAWKAEREKQQRQLLKALGERRLSNEELRRLTPDLNVFEMQPYFAAVKYAELYDLLLIQWELQTGQTLPVKTQLSRALGEYNRTPQEYDNKIAVEQMIWKLKAFASNP